MNFDVSPNSIVFSKINRLSPSRSSVKKNSDPVVLLPPYRLAYAIIFKKRPFYNKIIILSV